MRRSRPQRRPRGHGDRSCRSRPGQRPRRAKYKITEV